MVVKDYKEVGDLQKRTASERPSEAFNKFQTITQVLATYGLGKASEAIGQAISEAKFQPDYDKAQSDLDKGKRLNTTAKKQVDADTSQSDLLKAHKSQASEKDYENQPVETKNWVDERGADLDSYGLNFLNRWAVFFGENKQIADHESMYLHYLCTEMSIEGMEIAVETNDIGFSREVDVSDAKFQNFTCNFLYDRNMKTRRIFEKVLNKIRNFRTGRYGYRDDHKWKQIDLCVMNNYNMVSRIYRFKDVVISGMDALAMTTAGSESQTFQVSFEYSDFEVW